MSAQKKVSRDAIINAAYEILRKSGIEAVNARSIAKKLDCSTQPIYHTFSGMDELKAELVNVAEKLHDDCVRRYMEKSEYTPYIAYGMGFVFLAKEERELFRFLFMTGHGQARKPSNIPEILTVMCNDYGYSHDIAKALHENMLVYAFGLALGMNVGFLDMTENEIAQHFKTEFAALTSVYGKPYKRTEVKNEADTERTAKEF